MPSGVPRAGPGNPRLSSGLTGCTRNGTQNAKPLGHVRTLRRTFRPPARFPGMTAGRVPVSAGHAEVPGEGPFRPREQGSDDKGGAALRRRLIVAGTVPPLMNRGAKRRAPPSPSHRIFNGSGRPSRTAGSLAGIYAEGDRRGGEGSQKERTRRLRHDRRTGRMKIELRSAGANTGAAGGGAAPREVSDGQTTPHSPDGRGTRRGSGRRGRALMGPVRPA